MCFIDVGHHDDVTHSVTACQLPFADQSWVVRGGKYHGITMGVKENVGDFVVEEAVFEVVGVGNALFDIFFYSRYPLRDKSIPKI